VIGAGLLVIEILSVKTTEQEKAEIGR
jgi:hypothetical protein